MKTELRPIVCHVRKEKLAFWLVNEYIILEKTEIVPMVMTEGELWK